MLRSLKIRIRITTSGTPSRAIQRRKTDALSQRILGRPTHGRISKIWAHRLRTAVSSVAVSSLVLKSLQLSMYLGRRPSDVVFSLLHIKATLSMGSSSSSIVSRHPQLQIFHGGSLTAFRLGGQCRLPSTKGCRSWDRPYHRPGCWAKTVDGRHEPDQPKHLDRSTYMGRAERRRVLLLALSLHPQGHLRFKSLGGASGGKDTGVPRRERATYMR